MTRDGGDEPSDPGEGASAQEILLRLDLATEVLEGLEELGVDNRAQLEALLERLERRIDELE